MPLVAGGSAELPEKKEVYSSHFVMHSKKSTEESGQPSVKAPKISAKTNVGPTTPVTSKYFAKTKKPPGQQVC